MNLYLEAIRNPKGTRVMLNYGKNSVEMVPNSGLPANLPVFGDRKALFCELVSNLVPADTARAIAGVL